MRHISVPMLGGVLTALTDETIQIFSPGRSSQVTDVWLDSAGVLAGILTAIVLFGAARDCFNHRNKEKRMTIEQANQYFAALPDGFAYHGEQLGALRARPGAAGAVRGRSRHCRQERVARLLAAILHAQGIRARCTMPGAAPLSARICMMMARWTKPCWP